MSYTRHLPRSLFVALAGLAIGAFVLSGCDSAGPSSSDGSEVSVGFATASSSATASSFSKPSHDSLEITGSNGTLRVGEVYFIVSEVELEGDADSAEFETEKPAFVDFPLTSTDVEPVVNGRIPPGTYNEFEFEVEDADLDDDEDEEELQQLRADIEDAGFSDWPEAASMVVVGTFTPSDGTTREFTTYLDAEIEVEIEMEDRPFEVGGDDPARRLTVNLSPSRWFVSDGAPLDLSAEKYRNSEEPVELEIEFEEDSEIEFDD